MSTIVIFALEGVLQSESGRPVEAACRLYRNVRGSLLHQVGVLSAAPEDTARRFFDQQHLAAPTFTVAPIAQHPDDWMLACRQIRRAYPYEIDYVIVPDPAAAIELYREGFRVMLWTDPRYTRPDFRPEFRPGIGGWAELSAGLAEDQARIAADDRITRG